MAATQVGTFLAEQGMPTDPSNVTREHVTKWKASASNGLNGLLSQDERSRREESGQRLPNLSAGCGRGRPALPPQTAPD